jgi:hypothetical protein
MIKGGEKIPALYSDKIKSLIQTNGLGFFCIQNNLKQLNLQTVTINKLNLKQFNLLKQTIIQYNLKQLNCIK